jgi:peroxiredoxin
MFARFSGMHKSDIRFCLMNRSAVISGFVVIGCLGVVCVARAQADSAKPELSKPDVAILLVRDPVVQAELDLNERQIGRLDSVLADLDEVVFTTRDDQSVRAARKVMQALRQAERRLSGLLNRKQYRRLRNIVIQAQGYEALFELDLARRLKLSAKQQDEIRDALEETRGEIAALQAADAGTEDGEPDPFLARAIKRAEQLGEDRVHALLSAKQQKQWAQLRGPRFKFDGVAAPAPAAPELTGIAGWVNTDPLTLKQLRGQVVVLHFWSLSDRNCAAGYPVYRDWLARYGSLSFQVVGVHTPEFSQDAEAEAVTAQAKLNELAFPIALDNEAKTWTAWANPGWPTVYLIDRQGLVRYWWYGPLKSADADGEAFLRARIEELLAR